MARLILQEDITNDNLNASPRIRVNRTAPIALSTSWQTLDFTGSSPLNTNTFPIMPDGTRKIRWDSTNKKFVAELAPGEERNSDISFYYHITSNGLNTINVQMRFVIPAPTPFYFPFPDGRAYLDLVNIPALTDHGGEYGSNLYTNDLLRQYGMQVQLRLAPSLLGAAALADCAFIVFGA